MSDVDKAVCVKPYIFNKSFYQIDQLLVRKMGWDHRKVGLVPKCHH